MISALANSAHKLGRRWRQARGQQHAIEPLCSKLICAWHAARTLGNRNKPDDIQA